MLIYKNIIKYVTVLQANRGLFPVDSKIKQ